MADLQNDVRSLKGIGDKKAQAFSRLGIHTLYNLVTFYPRRYEDRSLTKSIALTQNGESVCIRAFVADQPQLSRIRRGLEILRLRAADETGIVTVSFFNQSYLKNTFHRGETYIFYGRIEFTGSRRSMTNPVFEPEASEGQMTGRILPVYRLTSGLRQRDLQQSVRQALDACRDCLPEVLPSNVLERCHLIGIQDAAEAIHFPPDFDMLAKARRRLIFEELFVLACALSRLRGERLRISGIPVLTSDLSEFWETLPFDPTSAQRRAVREAVEDMTGGTAMNRLVQGDVGSGKTLVAAALIWYVWKSGLSSAFMAPTEILADQHFETFSRFLSPLGLRIEKLTGASSSADKRRIREALSKGEIDLIIGTHALLNADLVYSRLGLVVTDEQHRFGVEQRAAFVEKGVRPHVLVMSATPIPRTLALMIYGDLDVSVLDELPPGRSRVDTFVVDESYRPRLNAFIRRLTGEGRQVFVVCPKVEEDEGSELSLKSAEAHAAALQRDFPELSVGCVHGRLKPKEKESVMASFAAGSTQLLVATTVVEVGVDVPNASLMIIENAERFGLSQLHQLRGRVGRGPHKSYCVLVSDAENAEARERLSVLCRTGDGFRISEEDLRLRGPGDFFGSRQHGLPEMHIADLGGDVPLLQLALREASRLMEEDRELNLPGHSVLRGRVESIVSRGAETLN